MPKQVDHAERRREIILAAAQVGQLQGLSNLSLSKIAIQAGISKGLVQHYFRSKEELLIVAAEHRDQLTESLMEQAVASTNGTPLAKLRAAMIALVPQNDADRYIALLGTAPFLIEIRDEDALEQIAQRHQTYLRRIESLIADAQAAGEINVAIDTATLSRLSTALIVGIVSRALSEYENQEEWTADIEAFLDTLRSGVRDRDVPDQTG